MYKNKRISVVLITYNGEQFIRVQLESILFQSVKPDEIIISDDGSSDRTNEVVSSILKDNESGIRVVRLFDNPRKGPGGNTDWALRHATGDIIFISGQDDIWMKNKIEMYVDVYSSNPEAKMVAARYNKIDERGNFLYDDNIDCHHTFTKVCDKLWKVDRKKNLEKLLSTPVYSGPILSISSSLLDKCLPIPIDSAEDGWLQFNAVLTDQFFFLDEKLTSYRIHNSVSRSVGLSLKERVKKIKFRLKKYERMFEENRLYGQAAYDVLTRDCFEEEYYLDAINAAKEIIKIGTYQADALNSNRIVGIIILFRLFITNKRYRKSGTKEFFNQVLYLLVRKR